MSIKKAVGFQTEDGRMFQTLDEAAGHAYGKQIKDVTGQTHFGAATIIRHSREIAAILNSYNAELDRLESEK